MTENKNNQTSADLKVYTQTVFNDLTEMLRNTKVSVEQLADFTSVSFVYPVLRNEFDKSGSNLIDSQHNLLMFKMSMVIVHYSESLLLLSLKKQKLFMHFYIMVDKDIKLFHSLEYRAFIEAVNSASSVQSASNYGALISKLLVKKRTTDGP